MITYTCESHHGHATSITRDLEREIDIMYGDNVVFNTIFYFNFNLFYYIYYLKSPKFIQVVLLVVT